MIDNKIVVAHVVNSLNVGGIEIFISNLIKYLKNNSRFKSIIYVQGDKIGYLENEIAQNNAIIIHTCKLSKHPFQYVKSLKRSFINEKVDIVHCHMNSRSAFPLLAAKQANIKFKIAHSHSSSYKANFFKKIINFFLKTSTQKLSNIKLACSDEAAKYLFKKNDVLIIKNAIDYNKFHFNEKDREYIRNKYSIEEKKIIIGCVGRTTKLKNHVFLLKLMKKIENMELFIVGSGPLKKYLDEEIKKTGLKNVRLIEANNEIFKYYSAFDIFALPSLFEGLPLTAIEAQVNGLPCILSTNITKECKITKNINFVNLNTEEWIKNINATKILAVQERKNVELLDYSFDLNNGMSRLAKIYLKCLE